MKDKIGLLKILLPFLRPYLKEIIFVALILPIAAFSFSIQPIILQRAIDGPIKIGDFNSLWLYVLALIAAVLVNFIVQVVQFWIINAVGQKTVADIRDKLFSHLEHLPMSYFDQTPVGRSVSRITSDIEQLGESFAGGLVLVVLDVFNIIGILIFMCYLNLNLSLILIVFLLPIFYLSKHYQRIFAKSNLESRHELSQLNSHLQQNVVGISVVQMLNSTGKSSQKFEYINKKYFKANDLSIKADAQLSALIETISLIAIATLIFLTSILIKNSTITVGIILAFIQYAQSLFEPIRNLSDRFTIIQSAFTSAQRIKQVLDEKPAEDKGEDLEINLEDHTCPPIDLFQNVQEQGLREAPQGLVRNLLVINEDERNAAIGHFGTSLISFENVWFRYNEDTDWILKGLSFQVAHGDHLAITGRTGSGKSTIIKLLLRLYEPQQGTIKISGVDIRQISIKSLRKLISAVHQDTYIFAGDLETNIKVGNNDANLNQVKPLLDLISKIKTSDYLSERGSNISSGEEQVINIARAALVNTPIVIFDEASSKIDSKTEKEIHEFLLNFLEKKTVIMIAHREESIKMMDKVLEL